MGETSDGSIENVYSQQKMFRDALQRLESYIRGNDYSGYDPYDALNSGFLGKMNSKQMRLAFTVLFRRSPVNLRRLFGIPKGRNPKALGLILSSYARLYKHEQVMDQSSTEEKVGVQKETLDHIFHWLCENRSEGYSGHSWGYNFPWQNRIRLLPAAFPTIVNTSYIGHAFLDYYEITGNKDAKERARSACDFILNYLTITERNNGICFSYAPKEKNLVHNANVLGASFLARVYSHTKEEDLLRYATKSIDFTVGSQNKDGRWDYSLDIETGRPKVQTDWHQGFIIDSLLWYIESVKPDDDKYKNALMKGAEFYKNQFTKEGIGYWRYPKLWPVNIHNQAQGIISFNKLEKLLPGSVHIAHKIACWTIKNLQAPEGYFYYQKGKFITNKIPYMRWAQAWMFLALADITHEEVR